MRAERIRLRGQVQGVGFRPFVWRLAQRFGARGLVGNDGEGVFVEIACTDMDGFVSAMIAERPPLARIDGIERQPVADEDFGPGFVIVASKQGNRDTGITPDAAICADCAAEIMDPSQRRFGYAFANCTNCGPRFSIVTDMPYDRASTTMARFVMCDACRAEYEDPGDRRFHAQPIACPACGPTLSFRPEGAGDALQRAIALLKSGGIVALKGLGGFHLACDARNEVAVSLLRQRKRRPHKPFALMAGDRAMLCRYASPSLAELAMLGSAAAPVVVLGGKDPALAPSVAPGIDALGWMLAYTPLHCLLLSGFDGPLVMTSGNLSGEPQVVGNEEAMTKLGGFADGFLLHDRDIARRLDDSVVALADGGIMMLRRARGYAPALLTMPPGLPDSAILALGGELKATLCLAGRGQALLSHHLGDLEDALTYSEFEKAIADYRDLFGRAPQVLACDTHPHYRSTEKAENLAAMLGLPVLHIQHHHAHIAAAMAENSWPADGGSVLGLALDGSGHGPDGTVWGGEILLCDYADFRALARLRPAPLPGGAAAVREPWRNLVMRLDQAMDPIESDHHLARLGLAGQPTATLRAMAAKGLNAPLASSAGRLFDAVGAALGCATLTSTYEGQAGMELESLARHHEDEPPYDLTIASTADRLIIDPAPLWLPLLADLGRGIDRGRIAARFQLGLADAFARAAITLAARHDCAAAALSGGVMQNQFVLARLRNRLTESGLQVLTHSQVPANDGGLALGQAAIAAAKLASTPG